MTTVFGKGYSSTYDLLYRDKDYDRECDQIEQIIRDNHRGPVTSILDLGCGTGNHSIRLAQRGYTVTGVDRSSEMLDIARQKSKDNNMDCSFIQSDIRTFNNKQKFDVVIMMFAVLGYLTENEDIEAALKTVKDNLNPGGLFICDVWYGPAVLHQRPGERVFILEEGDKIILRSSTGDLDILHQIVTVHYRLWKIEANRFIEDISEEHKMRFFFPRELGVLFNNAGLDLKTIQDFIDIRKEPSEDSWNIWVIAENSSG